jgi:hypothetical protein
VTNLPVPTIATAVPGGYVLSSLYNALGNSGLYFSLNVPLAILYQATTQSIPSGGGGTALTMDSEIADTYGGHSTSTNTSRYVGQVPGYYLVIGTAALAPNATGNRLVEIEKNGSIITSGISVGLAPGSANGTTIQSSVVVYLNGTTDYVEAYAYQTSGSALATSSNTGMTVIWIHS